MLSARQGRTPAGSSDRRVGRPPSTPCPGAGSPRTHRAAGAAKKRRGERGAQAGSAPEPKRRRAQATSAPQQKGSRSSSGRAGLGARGSGKDRSAAEGAGPAARLGGGGGRVQSPPRTEPQGCRCSAPVPQWRRAGAAGPSLELCPWDTAGRAAGSSDAAGAGGGRARLVASAAPLSQGTTRLLAPGVTEPQAWPESL